MALLVSFHIRLVWEVFAKCLTLYRWGKTYEIELPSTFLKKCYNISKSLVKKLKNFFKPPANYSSWQHSPTQFSFINRLTLRGPSGKIPFDVSLQQHTAQSISPEVIDIKLCTFSFTSKGGGIEESSFSQASFSFHSARGKKVDFPGSRKTPSGIPSIFFSPFSLSHFPDNTCHVGGSRRGVGGRKNAGKVEAKKSISFVKLQPPPPLGTPTCSSYPLDGYLWNASGLVVWKMCPRTQSRESWVKDRIRCGNDVVWVWGGG